MNRQRGLTFLELLVIVVILVLLVSILLPALHSGPHPMPRSMQNRANLHQLAIVLLTQGPEAKAGGYLPGLGPDGSVQDATVEGRYALLLQSRGFDAKCLLSPFEPGKRQPWRTGPVAPSHYSYAMLEIATPGQRRRGWNVNYADFRQPLLCDRNVATTPGSYASLQAPDAWRGEVAFADGHVSREKSHEIPSRLQVPPRPDNLFVAEGPDDFYLIYSGQ